MDQIRYSAAACQTDLPNPLDRRAMRANTDRMLSMIDSAVMGSAPFLPVRLVVFPEFAHSAPVFQTVAELREKLAVEIPNEHTERLEQKAREHDIYIQSGSMLEVNPKWAGLVFNTTCLIGPEGILYKYRKVNTWIPFEVHASPHDIEGYDEPLFPVADTPIGRIGCAICYDWIFPEAIRQLAANGAEVLVRVSAYMDPWGATEPMDWWTIVNRCRALENTAYVVAANDVSALRHERAVRRGHHMLGHLRTEAYPVYSEHRYPPRRRDDTNAPAELSYEENNRLIDEAKAAFESSRTTD